jgi:hypothetical protein
MSYLVYLCYQNERKVKYKENDRFSEWFYNSNYKQIIAWLKLMTDNVDFKDIIMAKHQPWQAADKPVYLFNPT